MTQIFSTQPLTLQCANRVRSKASHQYHSCVLIQGKPYALFGTCLGAIVAYEVTKRVAERKCAPMPLALFPAAVSPPHLYAVAVMKLYVQRAVGKCRSTPHMLTCQAASCGVANIQMLP